MNDYATAKSNYNHQRDYTDAVNLIGNTEKKINPDDVDIDTLINRKQKALDGAQYSGATSFIKNLITEMNKNNRLQIGYSASGQSDAYGRKRINNRSSIIQDIEPNDNIEQMNPVIRGNIEYVKKVQTKDAIIEPDIKIFDIEKILRDNSEFKNILEYFNKKANDLKLEKSTMEELLKGQSRKLGLDLEAIQVNLIDTEAERNFLKKQLYELTLNFQDIEAKYKKKRGKYRNLKKEFKNTRINAISKFEGVKDIEEVKATNESLFKDNKAQKAQIVKLLAMIKILQGKLNEALARKKEYGTKEIRYSIAIDQLGSSNKKEETNYLNDIDLKQIEEYDFERDPDNIYDQEDLDYQSSKDNSPTRIIKKAEEQLEINYLKEYNEKEDFKLGKRKSLERDIKKNLEVENQKLIVSNFEYKPSGKLDINSKMKEVDKKLFLNQIDQTSFKKVKVPEKRNLNPQNTLELKKKVSKTEKDEKMESNLRRKSILIKENLNKPSNQNINNNENIDSLGKIDKDKEIEDIENKVANRIENSLSINNENQKKINLSSEVDNFKDIEQNNENLTLEDYQGQSNIANITENNEQTPDILESQENKPYKLLHSLTKEVSKTYISNVKNSILLNDKSVQTLLDLTSFSDFIKSQNPKNSNLFQKIQEYRSENKDDKFLLSNPLKGLNTPEVSNIDSLSKSSNKLLPIKNKNDQNLMRGQRNLKSQDFTKRTETLDLDLVKIINSARNNTEIKKNLNASTFSNLLYKDESQNNIPTNYISRIDSKENIINDLQPKNMPTEAYNEMYSNLNDIIQNNPVYLKSNPLLCEILKEISKSGEIVLPDYDRFLKIIANFEDLHSKCGDICVHLKRFYEKLGINSEPKKNQRIIIPHKRNLNHFPKLIEKNF